MMKHYNSHTILWLAMLLMPIAMWAQPPYTMYFENFGAVLPPALPGGWSSTSGTTQTLNNTFSPGSGGNNLLMANCTPVGQTRRVTLSGVSTTGYEHIFIGFYHRRTNAFDVPVTIEWSNNGSTWYTVAGYSTPISSSTWVYYESGFLMPNAEADDQANLTFRFTWMTDDNNNCLTATPNFRIDDVGVYADIMLSAAVGGFRAKATPDGTALSWHTASEADNDYFLVQRSTDGGRTFATIGQVAGRGDSDERVDYTYVDDQPATGTNYYRLHQFDYDGTNAYFGPVSVTFVGQGDAVRVWPTLVENELTIATSGESDAALQLGVYDLNGRLLQQQTIREKALQSTWSVAHLPAGTYFVQWQQGAAQGHARFVKM